MYCFLPFVWFDELTTTYFYPQISPRIRDLSYPRSCWVNFAASYGCKICIEAYKRMLFLLYASIQRTPCATSSFAEATADTAGRTEGENISSCWHLRASLSTTCNVVYRRIRANGGGETPLLKAKIDLWVKTSSPRTDWWMCACRGCILLFLISSLR